MQEGGAGMVGDGRTGTGSRGATLTHNGLHLAGDIPASVQVHFLPFECETRRWRDAYLVSDSILCLYTRKKQPEDFPCPFPGLGINFRDRLQIYPRSVDSSAVVPSSFAPPDPRGRASRILPLPFCGVGLSASGALRLNLRRTTIPPH
jgi:hypothetical protein